MPVYTREQASTLYLTGGEPSEIIVEYTFVPGCFCPSLNCPRIKSPAANKPPETYPEEIAANLKLVKKWMQEAELADNYHPKAISETYFKTEFYLNANGILSFEFIAGMRSEDDPESIGSHPAIIKRQWNPETNLITTDARGEYNISYPAFQRLIQIQETFIQAINQMTAG